MAGSGYASSHRCGVSSISRVVEHIAPNKLKGAVAIRIDATTSALYIISIIYSSIVLDRAVSQAEICIRAEYNSSPVGAVRIASCDGNVIDIYLLFAT